MRSLRVRGARQLLTPPARPQLKNLKTELAQLRVAKVTGGAPNKLSKMCVTEQRSRSSAPANAPAFLAPTARSCGCRSRRC